MSSGVKAAGLLKPRANAGTGAGFAGEGHCTCGGWGSRNMREGGKEHTLLAGTNTITGVLAAPAQART